MTSIEQINAFFGAHEGWVVKALDEASAEIWFGATEFIGVLRFESGMWHAHNVGRPENHGKADNLVSVMGIHVGGGMINFLSNRAKQALRVCIANHLTQSMNAKIKNLK